MLHWFLPYRGLLANGVSIFHTVLSGWYLVGWLIWIPNRSKSWGHSCVMLYLFSLATMLLVNLFFGYCPLTALEKSLENGGEKKIEIGPGFIVESLNKFGLHPPAGLIMIGAWVIFALVMSLFVVDIVIFPSAKKET